MRIVDIPEFKDKTNVLTCVADTDVFRAVQKMHQQNVGSILIVDAEGKLEGIFTERDVLSKIVAGGAGCKINKAWGCHDQRCKGC